MCLLLETVSQVSDMARGALVVSFLTNESRGGISIKRTVLVCFHGLVFCTLESSNFNGNPNN